MSFMNTIGHKIDNEMRFVLTYGLWAAIESKIHYSILTAVDKNIYVWLESKNTHPEIERNGTNQ